MPAEVATVRGLRAAAEPIQTIHGKRAPRIRPVSIVQYIGGGFKGRFAEEGEDLTCLRAAMPGAGHGFSIVGEENFPVV